MYLTKFTIRGFDLLHQLTRLRIVKNLSDSEVELIVRTLADNVRTYEQVVEVFPFAPSRCTWTLIWSTAVGAHTLSCRRTTAPQLLLVPPTRVGTRSDGGHFQRAACTPCKCIPCPCAENDSCSFTGWRDIPPSAQSLSTLRVRATSPCTRVAYEIGECESAPPFAAADPRFAHAVEPE